MKFGNVTEQRPPMANFFNALGQCYLMIAQGSAIHSKENILQQLSILRGHANAAVEDCTPRLGEAGVRLSVDIECAMLQVIGAAQGKGGWEVDEADWMTIGTIGELTKLPPGHPGVSPPFGPP